MSVHQSPEERPERPARDERAASSKRTYVDEPTCGHCGRWVNPEKTIAGSYCSHECYYSDRGESALTNLEDDHKYCRSCFARVKDVEEPPEELDDYIVGFQYGTEHARRVSKEYERAPTAKGILKRRIGCACGNTELGEYDAAVAEADLERTLVSLVDALRDKYHEGRLDEKVDWRRLFEAYREHESIEYAVGVGLYE